MTSVNHSLGRRLHPFVLSALVVVGLGGCGETVRGELSRPEATGAETPSVLLITVDALRADHLGCYGFRLDSSPSIDRLAARGVRFESCMVQWPKTWPSLCSLLTGIYPRTSGIKYRRRRLPESLLFLSEIFQARGYATAAIIANCNIGRTYGFDQGFDTFIESWRERWRELHGETPFRQPSFTVKEYTNATLITDQAVAWLRQQPAGSPFFLWLHYIDPHGPYEPPAQYAEYFQESFPAEQVAIRQIPGYQLQFQPGGGEAITDLAHYRAQYTREIRYTDTEIGRLLHQLDSLTLADQTVIVLTADHGESLGEHDYYLEHGKFSYEVNAHVPLILVWPGRFPAGEDVLAPVGLIDLAPTLLDLAGIEPPDSFQGHSLVGLLRLRPAAPAPAAVFMESGHHEEFPQLSIRSAAWKLIQVTGQADRAGMTGSEFELYDLSVDPGETVNVAPEHIDVVARLSAQLDAWYADTTRVELGEELKLDELDEKSRQMLRALGYVD
ncbi:MAG: sulfatase [bacterium]